MPFISKWSWSPVDLVILVLLLSCSWVLSHGFFNLFFHPLCRLPGPFFGRMSPWPSAYHALKGDRHIWLENCFKKYGNKIRVEPNTVVFRSPAASRDIYGSKANVKRARFYDALMRKEEDRNTITTLDNTLHAKRRKLLNLAFTERSLRASTVFMQQHIDRWNELLVGNDISDWSEPRNFTDWVDRLVFDILGDICFGKSFEIKEEGNNPIREVPHAIVKTMRFVYTISKSPILGLIPWLRPRGLSRIFNSIRSKEIILYDNFIASSVKERLQREEKSKASPSSSTREDMFHFLCNAEDPDTGLPAFSDQDINAEAHLLLVAGSDSTSVTMSGLFFYLAHYPRVHAKLTEEVTSTFSTSDDIAPGSKLSSCKYLRACIDEAMRISPAGLSELPREVLPGGIEINGEFFPEGTVVGTANWTDGHNEEVYGDPEIFRPDRWIPGQGNSLEDVSFIRAAFHPFSMGPFNCAGTNFALQELMLMVAKTVYRLDFRPAPGFTASEGVPRFPLVDAYITVRDGPVLQFRPRSDY
ncbi:benzoate 4-monooxygenase cytochrome P450 [Melanomma pulvis-pyrius CBS 109.77]|uniref:Benzoate 4-monooxygenase cytochrome P450 n=1 Tax=Melanomma pulvis-pyrius CBS 109.77 TaxID=1314802 RepID=A0A6A6XPT9_9PLEO|nr:benzoate 4-monooxygenase cytochrome P450 [Melanomma pulvis-pyrius CBS 109.77]